MKLFNRKINIFLEDHPINIRMISRGIKISLSRYVPSSHTFPYVFPIRWTVDSYPAQYLPINPLPSEFT